MTSRKLSPCNLDLPIDVVAELLARLPVQTVLNFRRVCKSWNSLITSPGFVSLHLAQYENNNDDENTPILTYTCPGGYHLWMLRSTHTFKKVTNRCYTNLHGLGFKLPCNYNPCGSSVNGLLLLVKYPDPSDPKLTEIMLWNPILGKSHKLPALLIGEPCLGLGFSLSNNDYKVVAIANGTLPSVHVYTLSTCAWRSIDTYRKDIVHDVQSHGVLIEGIIFWVTEDYDKEGSQMVSFDVDDEAFDYITLPANDLMVYKRHPVAYRKCVGLLDVCWPSYNLWVMDNYQVPGAWTKLYTVDFQVSTIPDLICFKKNGQFIFGTREGGIRLCNIETQHIKHLMKGHLFFSTEFTYYGTLYKESLVFFRN